MGVTFIPRAAWKAGPLRSGYVVPEAQFVGLVAHHTVMVLPDYDRDGFLHGDVDDVVRYMQTLQSARPDLGLEVPYTDVVFRGETNDDCIVAEGRGRGVTGAHTEGFNSKRYGIAYAGNASIDDITPGVLEGFRFCGRQLVDPAGAVPTIGHRDTKSTECPGNHLYAVLDQIQPPFAAVAPPAETARKETEMLIARANHEDRIALVGDRGYHFAPSVVKAKRRPDVTLTEKGWDDLVDELEKSSKLVRIA